MSPDDPRHGTTRGYHAGCGCPGCRRAISRYEKLCRLRRVRGEVWAIPAGPYQERLRALMRLGWTAQDIADVGGWGDRNDIHRIMKGQKGKPTVWLERKTATKVAEVFERLCMTTPPRSSSRAVNAARGRTRARAKALGWPMPLDVDDLDVELEDEDVDWAVIERILEGDYHLPANKAERLAVYDRWEGSGGDLCRLTGWNIWRDLKTRSAA